MERILKVPYGLKDGELVTIDEVNSGLACGCICLCCGKPLVAKKGDITHHFAHYKSSECSGALQTPLHLLSKEIIDNSSTIVTPAFYLNDDFEYEIIPENQISVHNVQLEKRLGDIVPDIIIETKNEKKLIVEIVVSNKVNREKRRRIRELNIAAICVSVTELIQYLFHKRNFRLTDDVFRKELIESAKNKYWIHNPKAEAFLSHLRNTKAIKKVVKRLENYFGWLYFVNNCPLQKRKWERGFSIGKPYAKLEDCDRCTFNISIPELNSVPDTIYCIGHLKQNLKELIAQLTESNH